MTKPVNIREIALGILMEITEEEAFSHIVLRQVLEKYQYLEKRDRAFITRVVEGTLEHMIQMDYIIEQFSNVPVYNMKPLIRNLLRMSIYQMKYMDSVPDAAVCNEAVKLAQRKGFYNLKGFVNGVLRNTARRINHVKYPDPKTEPLHYLSVKYSFPIWMLSKWVAQFGYEKTEQICRDSHMERPTVVRCNLTRASKEEIIEDLEAQGITVRQHPYLDYALEISDYNYIKSVSAFRKGWIQVQDVSSMLVAEVAAPNWGDTCFDVCAAPGGKSLHIADKLMGSGHVEARDVSEYKVRLMQENIDRANLINIHAVLRDATVRDEASVQKADIVIADVPCSGLGVIGKKQDIKYKMSEKQQQDIIRLQRRILSVVQEYVKPGGVLVFSTCTIGADENQYNIKWFLENYPFRLESLDPYICDELKDRTTKGGYIQLLPGVHRSDGFFIARLRRLDAPGDEGFYFDEDEEDENGKKRY
ncbi:MAG: 16S rRNA (cytosine(967)-C(5))-methyltransferase RsmB [Lachnospiraceae bacterium]|uniref:16S rRNA (cytosine(967)-C(5))-methyltransferase RsmB n=1 Tax=Parablautia sp. Marseille-Q6255 TaxID=3039593 RepID=UPI0024BC1579|nr:16S rRNA (cytosine(967)-C(5))-methyltransferase RsmB [Parablautia sp. Marseille-Q6255]